LKAQPLHQSSQVADREVLSCKIAAMHLSHYLEHIEDGCLIITPGDRTDVILGSLASIYSDNYANIAGIVLTGGIAPSETAMRLIEGFRRPPVPIYLASADTYSTAMQVNTVRGAIAPNNERKIATALGIFESSVDTAQLEERIIESRSECVTPLMFEYELVERAKADRQHIVLPEGGEERILRAAERLLRRGVVQLTLLGNVQEIRDRAASLALDLTEARFLDPAAADCRHAFAEEYFRLRKHKGITEEYARDAMLDVSYFGTMMVHRGLADGMVSGSVHTTAHTIRPAFEIIRAKPGKSLVSSVFFMCLEDRVLVYGDCAVNPNPNPQQLADIAVSSAETAQQFGIEPCVALLSYATGQSGHGEDVDRVREATEIARTKRPDLRIEGPIQYDAAVDASVARTKLPQSHVAGQATVFIFPDLNTGNNTYKAVQRSAGAVAIGPVLQGLKRPVNDLSRGCTVPDIVNTVAITAIQAQSIDAAE
jgi:phosphate acetyltransferase